MKHLIALVKELGIKSDVIEELKNDEADVDYAHIVSSLKDANDEYNRKIYEPKIKDLESKLAQNNIKFKRLLKKNFNVTGISSNEIDSPDTKADDIIKIIKSQHTQEVSKFKENADKELQEKFQALTTEHLQLQKDYEAERDGREEFKTSLQKQYDQKENARKREKYMNGKYESYTGWDDKSKVAGYKLALNTKLSSLYDIESDGTIFAKGGGPAKHPSGKNVPAQHIDDVLPYHIEELNFHKKSNGGEIPQGGVKLSGNRVIKAEDMSPAQLKYLEAKKNQAAHNQGAIA